MSTNTAVGAERPRPKRRHIPIRVKREVVARQNCLCLCGCGHRVSVASLGATHFDHRPPLRLRDINEAGTDYDPPQHSIEHLDAVCVAEHHRRTHGTGATVAGTDIGAIKKERKRAKALAAAQKPKPKWGGKKLCSQGFQNQKGKRKWPARKLRSRKTP